MTQAYTFGPYNFDASGNLKVNIAAGSVSVGTVQVQGQYNLTPPVLVDGATADLQLDSSGRQLVNVSAWGGTATTLGTKNAVASVPVVLAADGAVNITQWGGTTVATGHSAPAGAVAVIPADSSSATPSSVASSASSVTVLAANALRLGAAVYNDSMAILYLLLSATGSASLTSYTIQVAPNGYYEAPYHYTGIIKGIWASANGNARVTEFLA